MQGFGRRRESAAGTRLALFTRALAVLLGAMAAARAVAAGWSSLESGAAGVAAFGLAALALRGILRRYARLVAREDEDDEIPIPPPPRPAPPSGLRRRERSGRRLLADADDPTRPEGETR